MHWQSDPRPFKEIIDAFGVAHDWTDTEIARQLRVNSEAIRSWKSGARNCAMEPTMRLVMDLIEAYGPTTPVTPRRRKRRA